MGRTDGTAGGDMRQFLPGSETQDLRPSTPGMAQSHPPSALRAQGLETHLQILMAVVIHLDSMVTCVCSDANLMTGHFQLSKTHLCPHREISGVRWGWGPG